MLQGLQRLPVERDVSFRDVFFHISTSEAIFRWEVYCKASHSRDLIIVEVSYCDKNEYLAVALRMTFDRTSRMIGAVIVDEDNFVDKEQLSVETATRVRI